MAYSYAETLRYDLVVCGLVAVVMPAAVAMLRSKGNLGRGAGAALLAVAIFYIGVVEHVRLHKPEMVTTEQLRMLYQQASEVASEAA